MRDVIDSRQVQACSPPTQLEQARAEFASPEVVWVVGESRLRPSHSPARRLLFYEFCEALLRVALLTQEDPEVDLVTHVTSFLVDRVLAPNLQVCLPACLVWHVLGAPSIPYTRPTRSEMPCHF